MIRLRALVLAAAAVAATAAPLAAQERAPASPDVLAAAPSAPEDDNISPGWAFARSLILPGWGQASIGAYTRGGVYFAGAAASWFQLLKTIARLNQARNIEERRVRFAREEILAQASDSLRMVFEENPALLRERISQDPLVEDVRDLEASREQQREDWIAITLAWTLASAIDAYVGAHLADIPTDIAAAPRPGGGMRLQVSVPVRGWP